MDNVSNIGVIHENSAKGKCGYEVCWTGLKSVCPLVNDFIDEFSVRIKKVIEEHEDRDPICLKPMGKERRMIPLDHHSLFKYVQAFLEHKKAQRSKGKLGSAPRSVVFLRSAIKKQSLSTVIHWQEQKQGDQQNLRCHVI